jgi:hypothetical protein
MGERRNFFGNNSIIVTDFFYEWLKCKIYRLKCKFYRLKCKIYRLNCEFYRLKCEK